MSNTTVLVHLDDDTDPAPKVYTGDAGASPYVWADLNAQVRLCIVSRAEAMRLVKLGQDAGRLIAGAERNRGQS